MGSELIEAVLAILLGGPASFDRLYHLLGGDMSREDFLKYLEDSSSLKHHDGIWDIK